MALTIMARPERAEPGTYGETKKPKQFMLTDSSSEELDKVADELNISRSEVLERAIRSGGLECAKTFTPQVDDSK